MPMLPYFEEHQGMHALAFGRKATCTSAWAIIWWDTATLKGPITGTLTFFHGAGATPLTTAGAVITNLTRCHTFAPIARGLRNCCGLAFDANWNLFGNDNDHESLPNEYVPGRLVHVTPHAYFNWPRGWLIEKQPWRADLLETLNSNLGRYVPTGQACYDEAFLPEDSGTTCSWLSGAGVFSSAIASKQGRNFHGSSSSGSLMYQQCAACGCSRRSRRTDFCFVACHGRQ